MISFNRKDRFNKHLFLEYCLYTQKKDRALLKELHGYLLLLDDKLAYHWYRKGQLWDLLIGPTFRMRSHHIAKIKQLTKVSCIKC